MSRMYTALPAPPTDLIATEVTSNSVKLAWLKPRQAQQSSSSVVMVPDDDVSSYVVQYVGRTTSSLYGSGGDVVYRELGDVIRDTEHTVGGLRPNTVYELRVVALNSVGRGLPSRSIEVTTTELGQFLAHFTLIEPIYIYVYIYI